MAAATLGPRPASLTLLGGPADPRPSPTPLQRMMGLAPAELLEAQLTSLVTARHPGAGRRVFPALFQLLAYATATPSAYLDVQAGLLAELASGRPNGWARQHADMHRLLDVPAELFADTVEHAVRTPIALGAGDGLAEVPLSTIEAGGDGLVGPGQTHAAHDRLASFGVHHAGRHTVLGADHHDLFTGPRFQQEVVRVIVTLAATG
jgi:poly(3-hydroxybutyrate) depolymerase